MSAGAITPSLNQAESRRRKQKINPGPGFAPLTAARPEQTGLSCNRSEPVY